MDNKIITLNIGGVKYHTTRCTLEKDGPNFFSGLLSGNVSTLIDNDHFYFIDRPGHLFAPILEFLHTGKSFFGEFSGS